MDVLGDVKVPIVKEGPPEFDLFFGGQGHWDCDLDLDEIRGQKAIDISTFDLLTRYILFNLSEN